MIESCGGNFQEGNHHGNGLQLIREYFQQRSCRHCCRNYAAEGIELVREEPGMIVVRVSCASCGQPLGIALVGVGNGSGGSGDAKSSPRLHGQHLPPAYPSDWSKTDIKRLSGYGPISGDDVIDAHKFFSSLNSDWHRYLPERARRAPRNLS